MSKHEKQAPIKSRGPTACTHPRLISALSATSIPPSLWVVPAMHQQSNTTPNFCPNPLSSLASHRLAVNVRIRMCRLFHIRFFPSFSFCSSSSRPINHLFLSLWCINLTAAAMVASCHCVFHITFSSFISQSQQLELLRAIHDV